ncbi:hypothetical protein [Roseibium aggregatum]|uniref:hypothetical protein n=1 Tax=Roseibium aggregatum TaxID=187304 RepID=UPI003A974F06
MVELIKQVEAIPETYPDVPDGLSTAAAALDSDFLWQRIENYVAHRWTTREVVWTVDGPGDWVPNLTPVSVTSVEVWSDGAWSSVTLNPMPLGGYWLPSACAYRFTADVGGGDVPAVVNEAFKRLAEYAAATVEEPGAASYRYTVGQLSVSWRKSPDWIAKGLVQSGAADLLRPYRRA